MPIMFRDEAVSVLEFFSREVREPDQDLRETMDSIGAQLNLFMERRCAEQELRDKQQQLQAILDNAPAVVYLKDARRDFRYLLVNRQFEALFEMSREQPLGKRDHDLFPREMADALLANDRKVLETGSALEFEELVPQEDGLHTYISVKFPLCDAAKVPYAVCGISTDITERKQVEETKRVLLHQQGHLMDRVEPLLDGIAALGRAAPQVSEGLSGPLRRVQTVVRQVKAEARTTLNFLRPPGGEFTWPELRSREKIT
jgi:PAS domain S-box-containing protein